MTTVTKSQGSFDPSRPSLTKDDNVDEAYKQQIVDFPVVVRRQFDPVIPGQTFGNVSFMLFDEPKSLNGKPVFGYVKIRGNHESKDAATTDAMRIVRDVDSKFQVRISEVGHWVPITDSDRVIKDLYDVKGEDQEVQLRDLAVKRKQEEDDRKMREIRDAETKIKSDGDDIYDDPESIRYYVMKRVTEMTLAEANRAQLLKYETMKKKTLEQRLILKNLEKDHPSYTDEWIKVYNDERATRGLPNFIPGKTQFREYEDSTIDDLEKDLEILNQPNDVSKKSTSKV